MELNKEEKGKEFYDNFFANSKQKRDYTKHYSETHYYPFWKELIANLPHKRILEVGCGTGQLAHMLYDLGYKQYTGFDFSSVAIDIAKKMCPEQNFFVGDAYDKSNYKDYDIILSTEVFEHLDDYKVLDSIESGKEMFFMVPRLDMEAHVRRFVNRDDLHKRYDDLIDIKKVSYRNKTLWLVHGVKK